MGSNTKAYLLSLLLLFLLLHTSVAGMPNLGKIWNKLLPKSFEGRKRLVEILNDIPVDDIINAISSPPPPASAFAPPQKINGLKLVKEYMNSYGYFPDSNNFTDLLDQQTKSSIQEYQQFFNLSVTGYPNKVTLQHMSLLRCAVPDKNLTYDLPKANFSWPLGTQWFPNGRMNLTYGFAPGNQLPENVTKVFEDSFKRWSDAITVLNLTETKYKDADIKIGFYTFDNGTIWKEEVGGTIIELMPGNDSQPDVTSGYMVMVAEKSWALPTDNINSSSWKYDVVDLETVVMHQIGHLLGLEHSSHIDSVMYPSILPSMQRKVKLSDDDKEQINQVYFSSESGHGVTKLVGSLWGLVTTTLSLGLACIVLLH